MLSMTWHSVTCRHKVNLLSGNLCLCESQSFKNVSLARCKHIKYHIKYHYSDSGQ